MKIKKNVIGIELITNCYQARNGSIVIAFCNNTIELNKENANAIADSLRPNLSEEMFDKFYNLKK